MIAAPTLDELHREPGLVASLPRQVIADLYGHVARLEADLRARLLASVGEAAGTVTAASSSANDRLLTPQDAADALGVTVPWLYRHAAHLPFARRLSRKCLRFSEAGLLRWQAARRP